MIWCVEDDAGIRDIEVYALQSTGFEAQGFEDGTSFWEALKTAKPQLVILDVMLPGDDGLALCQELRGQGNLVPIIMLTAVGEEIDRIVGLEMGADDYLPKPFNPRELLARIKAVLRRHPIIEAPVTASSDDCLFFDRWTLNLARRELCDDNKITVSLSTAEFNLLQVFTHHPHHVLSRDQLLDLARGREAQAFDRAIDTLVSRLRRKLEVDSKQPQLIKTIWGGGYLFAADVRHGH